MKTITIELTEAEAREELEHRHPREDGHETDCHDEPAFHPSGDEYSVGRAYCREPGCAWYVAGEPDEVRDKAAAHTRETAPADIVADKLRAALGDL